MGEGGIIFYIVIYKLDIISSLVYFIWKYCNFDINFIVIFLLFLYFKFMEIKKFKFYYFVNLIFEFFWKRYLFKLYFIIIKYYY